MSRVTDVIRDANASGRGVLVGYLPAGFPSVDECIEALVALAEGGADIIELGIPYSDPVMDGLVIQRATNTALESGFRVRDVFSIISAVTARVDVPILVMTYWNPVVQYGVERFARDLVDAGGVGLITPDLIPDEAAEWIRVSDALELDRVFLAAPSSTDTRLRSAVENSRGFVYAVSTMGITGTREDLDSAARDLVARLRAVGAETVCVGVGISSAEHVHAVCDYADGAIVGTLLVTTLENDGPAGVRSIAAKLSSGVSSVTP